MTSLPKFQLKSTSSSRPLVLQYLPQILGIYLSSRQNLKDRKVTQMFEAFLLSLYHAIYLDQAGTAEKSNPGTLKTKQLLSIFF